MRQNWPERLWLVQHGQSQGNVARDAADEFDPWQERAVLRGHQGAVRALAFSPDGKTLVSGSSDRTIRVWDTNTGQERATWKTHKEAVRALAFSPNGKLLASGDDGGTTFVWDVATGKAQRSTKANGSQVAALAFSRRDL